VLRTEGLTIRFGGLTALNNVNLEIHRGEIRAIIGPNGAGKSTFFNCVTGVLRPTSGRILLNGADITGLPPNLISRAGVARSYQITNILPNATTSRTCASPRNRAATAGTCSATKSVPRHHRQGASGVAGRPGRQGRRIRPQPVARRAAQSEIGIALATEPQPLCLDEPTAGMSAAETYRHHSVGARDHEPILIVSRHAAGHGPADRITVFQYRPSRLTAAGGNPNNARAELSLTVRRKKRLKISHHGTAGAVEGLHTTMAEPHPARGVAHLGCGEVVGLLGRNGPARAPRSRPSWAWFSGNRADCARAGRSPPCRHINRQTRHRLRRRIAASSACSRCWKIFAPPRPSRRDRRAQAGIARVAYFRCWASGAPGGGTLSGGEQQMLAIARAMLEPKIILLDEPTEGLMPRMVSQIHQIIDALHREGVAILLVEQNVPLTLEASQRVYLMEKGVIRHHAKASDLKVGDDVIKQYLGV
jgi:ABC-type branched-subunit amino acid transport system ATPase component